MSTTAHGYTDPTGSALVQTVASNVRAEAVRRGYTQSSLGLALNQAQSTMSGKWRGKRAWRLEDLEDIADVLKVPITTLIARPEGFEPPTF